MKGLDAFCPKTGAPLSEERHYDDRGRPQRAVRSTHDTSDGETANELTTGAIRSSRAALFNRFRRCHQHHNDTDAELYRTVALALRRLKRTASGTEEWDVHVWYALQRHLDVAGYDVDWMDVHAEPRCPDCHGALVYDAPDDGVVHARCGTNCTGRYHEDQLPKIRATVAGLYARTFDEPVAEDAFFRF